MKKLLILATTVLLMATPVFAATNAKARGEGTKRLSSSPISDSIGSLKDKEKLEVFDKDKSWYKISEKTNVWVHQDFVEVTDKATLAKYQQVKFGYTLLSEFESGIPEKVEDQAKFETALYSLAGVIPVDGSFSYNVRIDKNPNSEVLNMLRTVMRDVKEIEMIKDAKDTRFKTKVKLSIVVNISYTSKKSYIAIYKVK